MHALRSAVQTMPPGGWQRRLLRFDGLFFLLVGSVAMIQEAAGHFAGIGPLSHLAQSPYTIGGFEAHGLAVILGLLLSRGAAEHDARVWHRYALAIHALLGAANIAFWGSFVAFDLAPVGVVATIAHVAFVASHAVCLRAPDRPATATACQLERVVRRQR